MRGPILIIVLLALCLPGCIQRKVTTQTGTGGATVTTRRAVDGSQTTTIETPKGTMTTTTDGDGSTIKIEGEDGLIEIKTGDKVDDSEFGVPIYPGAEVKADSTMDDAKTGGSTMMKALVTADSVEKVKSFYETRLPGWTAATFGGTAMFSKDSDEEKGAVTITGNSGTGETNITIIVLKK